MHNKRKYLNMLLVAVIAAVSVFATNGRVATADDESSVQISEDEFPIQTAADESPIQTFIDTDRLNPLVYTHFVGPALYLPFTDIAAYLGATLEYDDEQAKTIVKLGLRYGILIEGFEYLIYGKLTDDGQAYATINTHKMEGVPMRLEGAWEELMVSHDTLVTALGAKVVWTPETRSVFMTSPVIEMPKPAEPAETVPEQPAAVPDEVPETVPEQPAATPTPAPTPTPAVNPAFMKSPYFQEVSGRRVQDMHTYKNKFVLVYYNSANFNAVGEVTAIKEAAATAGVTFQIVGVDESSPTSTTNDQLKWIWDYIARGSTQNTVLFLHPANGNIEVYQPLPSQIEMIDMFKRLENVRVTASNATPTPTPVVVAATPTPVPAVPVNDLGIPTSWERIDVATSQTKYDNGERFAFLFMNTRDADYNKQYVDIVIRAAQAANTLKVYYCDQAYDGNWWGKEHYGGSDVKVPNVTLFVVLSKSNVERDPRPNDVDYTRGMLSKL